MKQETIIKAVEVINRIINDYQEKLTEQLVLRAESRLKSSYHSCSSDCESNIKKYEIIIADLVIIKKAIQKNQRFVKTFETSRISYGIYYKETSDALYAAGFYGIQNVNSWTLDLYPIDEMDD